MKHLFIINSHTTFLTSMGTAEYLSLPQNDVIFAYMRNYKNSITKVPYKVIDVTELYNSTVQYYNGKQLREVIGEVDEFIKNKINCPYNLYVPHLVVPLFKILYTSKFCKRVSYIQEGAYTSPKAFTTNISTLKKIKQFIKLRFRGDRWFDGEWYMAGTIYKQRYLDSYAINDRFWQYLPSRKHIVKWPKPEIKVEMDRDYPVFIFDGFIKNGHVEQDIYIKNIKRLVEEYASSNGNYIKFHPAQAEGEKKEILNVFRNNEKNVRIFDNSFPMEYIIMSTNNMTYVGFGSSLLYYARDFGHKVICHEEWLIETSEKYRKFKARYGVPNFSNINA